MNWVDVLVAISVLWSGLRGVQRGFAYQLLSAIAVILGVLLGLWVYAYWTSIGGRGSAMASHALRFLVSVAVGMITFGVLELAAERSGSRLNASILGPLNRMLGLLVGFGSGLIAAALVLLAIVHAPLPHAAHRAIVESWSVPRLFREAAVGTRALSRHVPGLHGLADAFGRAAHPAPPRQ